MFDAPPDGWQRRSLSSLGEYENGFAFNELHWSEHGLPIVRIAQITGSQGIVDRYPGRLPVTYRIDSGDLIFSWSGTLAVVQWTGGPAWLNQHLFKVVPGSGIDRSLLFQLLHASVAEMNKRTHGSTMKHIKRGELREFFVTLPVDRDEQRKLAQVLNTLDTVIHETEAIIAKLKAVKQGLLHDLLTRGIDANGELRPPQAEAPHLYKESPLGWVPKEWAVEPFGSMIDVIDPNPSHRYPQEQDVGVPICSTENFDGEDGYLLDRSKKMPNSVFVSQNLRCEFSEEQVIFARKGRIGLARQYGHEKKVFSHTIVVFARKNESVDQKWLLWLARSAGFLNAIRIKMNSNSGVPTLGIELINSVVTAFPPVPEQADIGKILDSTLSRLRQEERKRAGLMNLKRGLMKDLLTGRVRVTPLLAEAAQQQGGA